MGLGRCWCLLGVAAAVSALVPGAACGGSDDGGGDGGADAGSIDGATSCAAPSGTITHDTTIAADETWAGDVTHIVPGDLRVDSATLTIEACAIVRLGAGASITVSGDPGAGQPAALVASGAGPTQTVTFVRADEAEPWGILRGYDDSSRIELHYAELRGGGAFGGQYGDPAIAMNGSSYGDPPVGLLEVDHVLIDGAQGNGIYFDTNAAFTDDSTALTIQGAGDSALVMTMMAVGSIPDGTYTGNGSDEALVFGQFNVFADLTVRRRLPIRIPVGSMVIAAPINDTFPVTLTLEPGVELRFPPLSGNPGARVQFGTNGNDPDNKVGVLDAQGTEASPIVFTSGADTPAAGDWAGLWLDTATGSRLDHVIIEFAGADNGISSSNCRPDDVSDDAALVVGDFSDQYVPPADLLTSSIIRASAGNGVNAVWVGPELGPDLTGGGNTISDVAECAQTYNSQEDPEACPMQGCF